MINYLISQKKVADKELNTNLMQEIMHILFMYITGTETDPFYSSLAMIDNKRMFDYYIDSCKAKTYIDQDCMTIQNEMKTLLFDIADGKYLKENIMKDKALQAKIVSINKSLAECMKLKGRELTYYKMNLSERNLPIMLLA